MKPGISARYTVIVRDKRGRIVARRSGLSKSFVKNMLIALLSAFQNADKTAVDVNGSSTTITLAGTGYSHTPLSINAGDDSDVFGIVVGSGTTSPTPDDYNLESKIAHGTGAGQLDYDTHTFTEVSVSGSESLFEVARSFKNLSGGDVTVSEVGIIAQNHRSDIGTHYFLVARDVLASPVTVPDGGSLTVKYTIKAAV